MRVVVVGATGNVGTSLVASLASDARVDSIVGLARRVPELRVPKTEWRAADVSRSDLVEPLRGADAVVHLAWLIQPSRDLDALYATNVTGSRRVFDAVAEARVPALVYASSVGTYSPGPKDRGVDESWPARGIGTSFYSRHKADVEAMLDAFERDHPSVRVVRLRPALIFKRDAASGVRRLFAGPLLPTSLLRRSLLPIVPNVARLRFQAVHTDDVAEAYRSAILGDARGAFNVAADPVLDPDVLGRVAGARPVRVSARVVRAATDATWRLHLQPTPPGWVDMGLQTPIMDTSRARAELGWTPRRSATEALVELLEGMRTNAGIATPPLAPHTGGPLRIRELATGVGRR
ncbi:MAG TPA: NAD-dependent epimerase/dehydratase family protein [Actinomycetota bacterium]|nr:NAD-dependent epimerase/dehydratase family protein [Actinomycetota bacterium]